MLDIRFIRENEAIIREAIALKKSDCDLDLLLKLKIFKRQLQFWITLNSTMRLKQIGRPWLKWPLKAKMCTLLNIVMEH